MKKFPFKDFLIPLVVASLVAVLYLFVPGYSLLTWRLYDLSLLVKPSPPEEWAFAIANIDDESIEIIGTYPLGRDVIARGLITLSEFEARVIAIDSEFLDVSPRGVREDFVRGQLPDFIRDSIGSLGTVTEQLAQALVTPDLFGPEDLPFLLDDYWFFNDLVTEDILDKIGLVVEDKDELLGNAGRFAGMVYATVSPDFDRRRELTPGHWALLHDRVAIPNIIIEQGENPNAHQTQNHPFVRAEGISSTIYPVLRGMEGGGSVVQPVDDDGVRRRADLFFEQDGRFYPHLGLAALLDWFGHPTIRVTSSSVTLEQANHPSRGQRDVTIPLGQDGRMIIHWPRASFLDSFRHIPFSRLFLDHERMTNLYFNLASVNRLDSRGLFNIIPDFLNPLSSYDQAEAALAAGMETGEDRYRQEFRRQRQEFLRRVEVFLQPGIADGIIAQFDELALDPEFLPEEQDGFFQRARILEQLVAAIEEDYSFIQSNRAVLAREVPGSFIVIGYSGQSTTDIGVNPFENQYMNVGIFPAAMNTIYQELFITDRPWWFSGLIVLPLVVLVPILFHVLSPLVGFAITTILMVLVHGGFFASLTIWGVYLDQLMVLSLFAPTILFSLVLNFRRSTSQKAFITDAFGQYLSQEVIDELIEDPEKLKLGGEKREMTAIFTDVKGFSTISEQLDPTELVTLLNEYLSAMSDIILDQKGTIDKYEGDAIIAFYGAPMDLPDHALRACKSAVLMRKAEIELNKRFLQANMTPTPLFTRIGINSGPMVVGNMGTQRKKNYTIMGNAVNLAARLEGVNKQYGTAILISQSTYEQTGNELLVRRLDRVRVVGINTPVRLYQVLDLYSESLPAHRLAVKEFEAGMDLFEARKYREAFKTWVELYKADPKDETLKIYLERCREYVKQPRPADWDGVYDLFSK